MTRNNMAKGPENGYDGIRSYAIPSELGLLPLQSLVGRMAHYAEYLTSDFEKEIAKEEYVKFAAELATRDVQDFDISLARKRLEKKLGHDKKLDLPPVKRSNTRSS